MIILMYSTYGRGHHPVYISLDIVKTLRAIGSLGHIVEGDATRGTTTLVYLQLHISLYTGTVYALSRVAGIHPLV